MKLYLDTEFTDFRYADLISIGLVDQAGRSFYGENGEYSQKHCSDFARKVVVPQLGKRPECVYGSPGLRDAVAIWLGAYEATGAVVCIDFEGDWTLFCELMGQKMPYFVTALNIYPQIDKNLKAQYFRDTGQAEHHALHDAFANKFAHRTTS